MSRYWHAPDHGGHTAQYVALYYTYLDLVHGRWLTQEVSENLKTVPYGTSKSPRLTNFAKADENFTDVHQHPNATAHRIAVEFVWYRPRQDRKTVIDGFAKTVVQDYWGPDGFGDQSACPESLGSASQCSSIAKPKDQTPPSFGTMQLQIGGVQCVGQQVTFAATLTDTTGNPLTNVVVRFSVSGANTIDMSAVTGADGVANVSYTPTNSGTDTVIAWADLNDDQVQSSNEPYVSEQYSIS